MSASVMAIGSPLVEIFMSALDRQLMMTGWNNACISSTSPRLISMPLAALPDGLGWEPLRRCGGDRFSGRSRVARPRPVRRRKFDEDLLVPT